MSTVSFESPAVQSYLTILQGVIGRMASNSAASKTWCIALVSAVLVVSVDKGNPNYVWICLVPILLLMFLDAYYLGMERQFRDLYNQFVKKVHSEQATIDDVFIVAPGTGAGTTLGSTTRALASISIGPFYSLLVVTLSLVRLLISPPAG